VEWLAKGMHLLRQRQRGKHKWKPVTADWQIAEAGQQKAIYLARMADRASLLRRRRRARVPKRRQFENAEEI
jgi:putative ribosome biogenesis GTPase RsgA